VVNQYHTDKVKIGFVLFDEIEKASEALWNPLLGILDKAALTLGDMGAMDAWFGRHLVTFTPRWFDVIEAGEHLSGSQIEEFKVAFKEKLAKAIARSFEFKNARNVCTP
jgi:hypothetical protein